VTTCFNHNLNICATRLSKTGNWNWSGKGMASKKKKREKESGKERRREKMRDSDNLRGSWGPGGRDKCRDRKRQREVDRK